jgi:hypothetical protein
MNGLRIVASTNQTLNSEQILYMGITENYGDRDGTVVKVAGSIPDGVIGILH